MKKSIKILIIAIVLIGIVTAVLIVKNSNKKVICIDAGHGGEDEGDCLLKLIP